MSDPPPPFDVAGAALEVFDTLTEGVVLLDGGWTVQYANQAALDAIERTAEEVLGRDARTVDPVLLTTDFHATHQRVMRTRVAETVEDRYPTVDRWFRNRVLPCGDGLALLFSEITDAHRARRTLLGRLEVLQQVVDHAESGIVLKDLDGRYLLVNRASAALTGLTPAELVGRTSADILPPEIAEPLRACELEVQRTGCATQREESIVFPDGPARTWLTVTFPAYDDDGTLVGTGSIHTDVTWWKRTEAELEASERRLREVFAASSLGQSLMRLSGSHEVLEVNDAFASMLGYTREELLGTDGRRLADPERPWSEREERLTGTGSYEREDHLVHRDGSLVPVLVTITPLHDPDGGPLAFSVVRDLRPLRALQERLVSAERMEAVGRLAGGIAHDVNNVLSAVSGYAQLLTREVEGSERGERLVGGIFRTVERVGDLVAQLLAFARQQELQPVEQDLCDLVLDLEDMLQRLLPDGVRLVVTRSAVTRVQADASQLQQVLLNLVVNARNALPHGGTIEVQLDVADLTADDGGPLPPGRYARLVVADDGIGMPPEVASRCFEPFFTTRARSGGHGLGLSTAYGIARQSGGDLRVESAPGAGSRFTLLLPAESAVSTDDPYPQERGRAPAAEPVAREDGP